jgi:hypothetical protein
MDPIESALTVGWRGGINEGGQGKRLGQSSKLASESKPDGFKDVSIEAQLQKEQLTTQFNGRHSF